MKFDGATFLFSLRNQNFHGEQFLLLNKLE
jgi:hypothetical protein